MDENTLVIAEENKSLRERLVTYFSDNSDFKLVGCCDNGVDAVRLIQEKSPKVSIIDLLLPEIDGYEVLDRIKNFNIDTKVIVLGSFSDENMVKNAITKGAIYYIVKPFNFETLSMRLLEVLKVRENKDERRKVISIEEKISNIIISVGIPAHIKGYSFLREAVKMAIENPYIINNITKQLYPKIGERFSTTASKVERAIRHAIEVAWNRGRIENINNIFNVRALVGTEKPTNGEFIALIADKLLLEGA